MKKILPKKTLQIISVCFSILLFLTNESFEQNAPVKYKATTTYPDLTLDDNFKYAQDTNQKVFLFYKDYATSKGIVRKFNDTGWHTVSDETFPKTKIFHPNIAVNNQGTPYAIYQDQKNQGKASVLKYNGQSWEYVGGQPGISDRSVSNTGIAVTKNGTPYIIYSDASLRNRLKVKYFSNGKWLTANDSVFNVGITYSGCITTDNNGKIYVAVVDKTDSIRLKIFSFNGFEWKYLGCLQSESNRIYTDLRSVKIKVDKNNVLYVCFSDYFIDKFGYYIIGGTVEKYSNNKWRLLGDRGSIYPPDFQVLYIGDFELDFNHDNIPYVSYYSFGYSVEKYNGNNWEMVGNDNIGGLTGGGSIPSGLFFDKANLPSLLYIDPERSNYGSLIQYKNGTWTKDSDAVENNAIAKSLITNNLKISVSPNPVVNNVTLSFFVSQNNLPYRVNIINENGNVISIASGLAHTGINNVQLKTQNIKSGMYIIKLSTENGSGEFKVIKE